MKYKYTAFNQKGMTISDTIVARNKTEAKERLASQGLTVESLSSDILGALGDLTKTSVTGVSYKDKIVFTRNLAVMVKAGLTLDETLAILAEQSTNPKLTRILLDINAQIHAGKTLAEGLAAHPSVFDQLYINIVSAAEKSGTLEKSLNQLANQLNQTYEVRAKIRNALFYPTMVVSGTVAVSILLSIFVLPKVTRLFSSFNTELPLSTRLLISFSAFVTTHHILVPALIVALVAGLPIFLRSRPIRPYWHRLMLRLPVFKRFSRNFNLALFCRTLGTLLASGVPINQALEITASTMRNLSYRNALQDAVATQQTGEPLGMALRQYPHLFTPMVFRMIAVGEESGNLEDVLIFLADFHEREIDYLSKNLTTILEPFLLVLIGIAVLIVALAIITPIYSITGSFRF